MPVDVDNAERSIVLTEQRPIDLLNRQKNIDQIMQLLNIVSDNKGSCTFALNGKWGTGKTFVLNMLEENLLTYQAGEKYLVFHYNCWKYDYYEEPLFAIVAALLEGIDEEIHLFSEEARIRAKVSLQMAQPVLKEIAAAVSKAKLGVDLTCVPEMIAEGRGLYEETKNSINKQKEYDPYFSFNSTLRYVQEQLEKLGKECTIVVVVDELDRCLPTYAIKVLERLHHLFYGLNNSAVVLAMDKEQIDHTIKRVFGNEIDIDQYLKKFIAFQMELDTGTIQGSFAQKYSDYFDMFDNTLIDTKVDIDEFCANLFDGLDSRTQENLMERIKTVHKILISEEKKDYSFLCFEMLWIVLVHNGLSDDIPISIEEGKFYIVKKRDMSTSLTAFSEYIGEKWVNISMQTSHLLSIKKIIYTIDKPIDIPQLLIWYLYGMYPNKSIEYQLCKDTPRLEEYHKNKKDLKRFVELLDIIN